MEMRIAANQFKERIQYGSCIRRVMSTFLTFILIFLLTLSSEVNSQSCGVPKVGKGQIFGGSDVQHGQFPW